MLSEENWQEKWSRSIESAKLRPLMYIGTRNIGFILRRPLELQLHAKVFHSPVKASINLSPNQFLITLNGGRLIKPIRDSISVRDKVKLDTGWQNEMGAEDADRFVSDFIHHRVSRQQYRAYMKTWRYKMFGPYGPRLTGLGTAAILGGKLSWGVRTNEGLWCQSFLDCWPTSKSFQINAEGVQLYLAAELNAEFFDDLPFTKQSCKYYTGLDWLTEMKSVRGHLVARRQQIKEPDIRVIWHEADDIICDAPGLTPNGVTEMLHRNRI